MINNLQLTTKKYYMDNFVKNIIGLLAVLFLMQSCSTICQRSIFKPIVGTIKDNKTKNLIEGEYMSVYSKDSILFYMEAFLGGKIILFGPPLIPVIPNFIRNYYDRIVDYHIMISHNLPDTLSINNLHFYRNGRLITPKHIKIPANSDTLKILPSKYYLFTFEFNKFRMKELKIMYKDNILIQIKRKKKLFHEFLLAS
ncbi:MAG: hypothetical protein LBQ28_09930 [Prevotellaceae bacterium]|jgi:hypothetical protein|nr:hypothetical protein [Prevotellaceae bacterium]